MLKPQQYLPIAAIVSSNSLHGHTFEFKASKELLNLLKS